ncbi:MAG TPA: choice-of-anchor tandem repeat GloVer-containing protein, partial [Chthonomonadales bacterium]|nr:choice-of-anchor tandem repeat GloVer-containing protein [Chthonomonadales bacterium]
GVFTVIHNQFDPGGGVGGLIQASDGSLMGACELGGPLAYGTLFRISPAGSSTTAAYFDGLAGGGVPQGPLIEGSDGNIYSACWQGGASNYGTIFKLVMNNRDDLDLTNNPGLFFQRTDNGDLAYWLLNGTSQAAHGLFTPPNPGSPQWHLAGTADLNRDSSLDLVWQNSVSGDLAYFLMQGPSLLPTGGVGFFNPQNPGSGWKLVSVCDINGDFSPDLIFQNQSSGDIGFWLMNGTTKLIGGLFSPSNPGSDIWRVAASYHDYTLDTTTLYFQNTRTADLAYWTMDRSFTRIAAGLLNPSNPGSPAWRFAALEDINGDGQPDIILQNTLTGTVG